MNNNKADKQVLNSAAYIKTFFYRNKGTAFLTLLVYISTAAFNILLSWYLQVLFDTIAQKAASELGKLTLIFCMFLLVSAIFSGVKYFAYPKFLERAMVQYRNQVFGDLLAKNVESFSADNTATYISAFTNDMIFIQDKYLKNIFTFVEMLIMLIGALALMFIYSISLTFIAIALSFLPLLVSLFLGGKLSQREKQVSSTNEFYVSTLKDILSGFLTIKTFQAEKDVYRQFDNINRTLEDDKKQAKRTEAFIDGIGQLSGIASHIGVMLIGTYFALGASTHLTIGMVIAFTNLMNFVLQPLTALPQLIGERKAAKELITKLSDNLNNNYEETGTVVLAKKATPPAIELFNVSYSHRDGNIGVADVSLKLEAGKIYAIVGASGSGKSTLLSLLIKSRQNYTGKILVDGIDLQQISTKSLYDTFALMQQEVFIFNTTIGNNITLFKDFAQEKLASAIQISGLDALIKDKGEAYQVGENGKNLSGGERQRIAIARTLIRDNSVILVDEVTSALDNLTALQINQTLLEMQDTTRLVVTHRLDEQILSRFDKIIVMKKGQVVELDSFDKLMEQKGYFYSLFTVAN